ncbi:unnamed protein product [Polarella glacialis]|uniref:Class I SAM-dependent methyltransferase n=1 Tax=Polarella glacialis TaxID=89957 RepID=A0A813GGX7_POLGL|nr:unnamed protein product [Polarella glacialis]
MWQHQAADYNESGNAASTTQLANLRSTLELLAPFWPSVRIVQQPSLVAARLFDPDSLHFVYLDARHEYEWVLLDLKTWWPLVRPRGFLAGDDMSHPPVEAAVLDFAASIGVQVHRFDNDFFIVRPG